ncbi:flagellar motor control protein ZomB [Tsukamurella paurometabola]|uniref:Arabinosyltransferase AftB n=1 Tax=Tsukamurella paurometabola (strain ATCC 8368 / DSM 20162 / CCUG 35730 / CIP 100753 / JCM 10117 / KCTC 9821 / NBRC 16120 / NCIMB 702349 / NCTC 13040) TaxID=521096 RepID=D5UQ51_TSUPD|nr:flagellar motor control protein ZomB [Tsukamurella paurometabola]ADG76819.1 arabinosyltransferase AftB [Tsukamurella paurometabola DSM 20162]
MPRSTSPDASAVGRTASTSSFPLPRVTLWLGVAACAVLFGYGAWQRRWIADDGLIVLRTVRNLLAGNGPVFNMGERVEVNTSAAWTYIIWFFSWISGVQTEYVVLTVALVLSVAAIPLAMLGTARLYKGGAGWKGLRGSGLLLLPAGGLVYMALPPARDFATSGLEVSLTIFWVALLWWLAIAWSQQDRDPRDPKDVRRSWIITLTTAFVAGLSWLVRPEMAVVGGLVLVVMVLAPIGLKQRLAVIAVAGFLPVAYQIFRMGYYGLPVPNTAIAKDASGSKWDQGFLYLTNLVEPYSLWLPVVALAIAVPLIVLPARGARTPLTGGFRLPRGGVTGLRDHLQRPAVIVAVMFLGGVIETLYWLRQGGDFMAGRVLLAPLFLLLLPVMVIPLRIPSRQEGDSRIKGAARLLGGSAGAAVAAVLWVLVIGWALHASTFRGMPDGTAIGKTGIVDERAFYSLQTGKSHPITADDYLDYPRMKSLQEILRQTPRGGVYLPSFDYDWWFIDPLPYPRPPDVPLTQTVFFTNLGMTSMNLPLDVRVWDQVGLAWPVATHTARLEDGRIGHDKEMFPDWAVAEAKAYPKRPALPPHIDPNWVNQARLALTCPQIQQLRDSYSAPMTFDLFKRNFKLSIATMGMRIDRVPEYTLRMCRMDVPPPLTPEQYTMPKN